MRYYQEVVADFMAASRRIFVSPEYRVELGNDNNFWIDVVAIEHATNQIYICEVTYDKNLSKLKGNVNKIGKIERYNNIRNELKNYIMGKAHLAGEWKLCIWVFVLRQCAQKAVALKIKSPEIPLKITFLECT